MIQSNFPPHFIYNNTDNVKYVLHICHVLGNFLSALCVLTYFVITAVLCNRDPHCSQSVDGETEAQREKELAQRIASGRIRIQTQVCLILSHLSPLLHRDPNIKCYNPLHTATEEDCQQVLEP